MTLHTLSSGSQGNCLLLSDGGTHILVDAGISTRRIKAGLAQLELSMDEQLEKAMNLFCIVVKMVYFKSKIS